MKYLIAALAVALCLSFFTMSTSTRTASAAPPPGCEDINSPAPNWLIENGVPDCQTANALVNAETACLAKLQEHFRNPSLAGSGAWFATASDDGVIFSNFCPQSDEIRFGLSPCSDWMTNGPGTGPGINPESSLEQCKAWANEAFYYGAYHGPVSHGQPGRCEGLRGFECVAVLTAEPTVVTLETPSFAPPDAGSGGLASSVTSSPLALLALLLSVGVAGGLLGLGAVLGTRTLRG